MSRTPDPVALRYAERLLAGCPTGATEEALRLHGIDRQTLDVLVELGALRVTIDTYTPGLRREPALQVRRYHLVRQR